MMGLFQRLLGRRPLESADYPDPAGGQQAAIVPRPWTVETARRKDERLPKFKTAAAASTGGGVREAPEISQARHKIKGAFTPSQPVTNRAFFAGRTQVLSTLIEAIEDRLAHVVVFGERGIGKTSLLHILTDLARDSDYLTLKATCGTGTTLHGLFRTLLREIPILYHRSIAPNNASSEAGSSLADLLPADTFDARELSMLLGELESCKILIVLDEYDRVEDEAFRISIAELIKNLSDYAAPVQLIIAGVSSNLHELIGYIPSIRRNIVGIPMPKLSSGEVEEIVRLGERTSGLSFDDQAIAMIETIAQGLPYLVRLACYHSSLSALGQGRVRITPADVANGLDRMVEEAVARLPEQLTHRVAAIDTALDHLLLDRVLRLAAGSNVWIGLQDIVEGTDTTGEAESVVTFMRERLIPGGLMTEDSSTPTPRFRFVDESLQSFLWINLARQRIGTPVAA